MRKSDYIKQQEALSPRRVLNMEYIPKIKEVWRQYDYDPDYLLDESDNFYNVLEDFFRSDKELREERKICSYAIADYCFQRHDDTRIYKLLFDLVRYSLCGFYDVKKHRYFTSSEVSPYTEWYLDLVGRGRHYHWLDKEDADRDSMEYIYSEEQYEELADKYSALFSNIAALFIAIDVSQYLDEKKMCDAHITRRNVDKFVKYGPNAGYIFDPYTMEYRKPKNFEEFTHYLHTQYWFHDPSKGYHIDAPYKWNPEIPSPRELMK